MNIPFLQKVREGIISFFFKKKSMLSKQEDNRLKYMYLNKNAVYS